MLHNYLLTSLRSLRKHKLFSILNITGLAIGLAAFLLISQFVRFERSYDAHYTNASQIYRLSTLETVNGAVDNKDAMMTYPAAELLLAEVPEVQMATVSLKLDEVVFRKGQNVVYETNVVTADSAFLEIFDHEILQGDRLTMLSEPNCLVLTADKAMDYFGSTDVVGREIEVMGEYQRPFKVTGVIQNVPLNTHYKFDILISDPTLVGRFDYKVWNSYNYYTYIVLDPQADLEALHDKMDALCDDKYGEDNSTYWKADPVGWIHLNSDYTFESEPPGNADAVRFMSLIALIILAIAWINYINLATARALDRAREVGLRKVIGAMRSQLIGQFMMEALVVNFAAACLAVALAQLALPFFHTLIGIEVMSNVWSHPAFVTDLVIFFVVGTLLSGFYPAMVLSSFEPVKVLKGRFRSSKYGSLLRKSLVGLQFAATITLIAATLTIHDQINYMLRRDIGIDTDYVVSFRMPARSEDAREEQINIWNSFKDELRSHVGIVHVGGTSNVPGGGGSDINSTTGATRLSGTSDWRRGTTYIQYNDDEFSEAVGLDIIAGRDFDRNRKSDTAVVIMNETFALRSGETNPSDAVGKYLQFEGDEPDDRYEVIGVIEDFNRTTLKSAVEPTLYFPWMSPSSTVVKLDPARFRDGLAYVEARWTEFFPNTPLEYIFLDERFERLYAQDRRFGQVFIVFSVLAIFIAALGLLGLSAFMAAQRTKEVGIRKVLGASIAGIIGLFYKDFARLIIVASVVSVPVVYFTMNAWLQNYAFRVDFEWAVIIVALILVCVLAFSVIASQVYKVAVLDPARTLKYE